MSQINCNATKCGFNSCKICTKKNVKVEGVFSKSKLGTFCQSFRNPVDTVSFKEELASDMLEDSSKEPKVSCSANYCLYNKNNCCHANTITVGASNAKYRSETQCDSFKLK